MSETFQKLTVQLIKLGAVVALSQVANQTAREAGSDTISEIAKAIRKVKHAYAERRQAA